ncbi:hypothetical protein D3C87_2027540 [compost metagenome]
MSETDDLEAFTEQVAACRLSLDAQAGRLSLSMPQKPELMLDWSAGLSLGGQPVAAQDLSAIPQVSMHRMVQA